MIEFKNVHVKINKKIVLNNMNFNIAKGNVLGVVGNNGAGKSTLLKSLATIIPLSEGSIIINKNDVHSNIKKCISFMIEDSKLDKNLSGYEFILMCLTYKGISNIEEKLNNYWPFDMEKYKHEKIDTYSQGMIQKTRILAALFASEDIILLDEPHNSLDPKSIIELRNLIIKKAKHGATIIISSHTINEIKEVCDYILILKNGVVNEMLEKQNFEMIESIIVKEDFYEDSTEIRTSKV